MQLLIFLRIDLTQIPDDLSLPKFAAQEQQLKNQVVKEFKKQAQLFKVVKDYLPEPRVLIEFSEEQQEAVYKLLRGMDIVDIIDTNVSIPEVKKESKQDGGAQDVEKLKGRLAKYRR